MAATPLMQQYYEIKKQNPGCILFFRMGDFFELFEEDAVVASKILGLTLTSRNNGAAGETPLCGFPHHAADRYVPKMVAAGYRIAICEQVEDPKLARGIVKRDVVEIISAGTAMDETNLNAKEANYLCAYMPAESAGESVFAFADVTTGYLAVSRSSVQAFECEFCRRMPKEVVVAEGCEIPAGVMDIVRSENILITEIPAFLFGAEHGRDVLFSHFKVESLVGLGLDGRDRETAVTGALLQYLMDQKKSELSHFTGLEILNLDDYMTLDPSTLRNLELVRPLNADDYSSTLCSVLDFTVTAMGGRVLKDWVSHPLISVEKIRERQSAVTELVGNPMALDELKESLTSILDMERLMGRVGSGRANARDLSGMGRSLCQASKVARVLSELHSPLFEQFRQVLELAKGRGEELLQNFNDDLPLTVREGGMIREGANVELDAMNADIQENLIAIRVVKSFVRQSYERRKFKKAVTDSDRENCVRYDRAAKPGVANLMDIYSKLTGKSIPEIEAEFAGQGYGVFKPAVGEAVVEALRPIREEATRLMADKAYLDSVYRAGAEKAACVANRTLRKVYKKVGFYQGL